MKSDCWKPGGGKEGQGPRQKGQGRPRGHNAHAAHHRDDVVFIAFTPSAFATTEDFGEQLIDSGATSHLCPDRSRFKNFRHISPIAIHAADGLSFDAVGRGDVETICRMEGAQLQPH
ncbi:hypothetical protein B0H14DRAFT_2374638 [Mycena olivaceomarginata]|nr:hypothetical protein B0H14DRAFT_2374638 [Mycena olivaceomarginata]